MNKNDLIAELQKIEGNPIVSIGIIKSWGKISLEIQDILPLYHHEDHKVDKTPEILELICSMDIKKGELK